MNKMKWITFAAFGSSLVAGLALAHGGHGRLFEKMDANKDGKVTKAEADTARNAWFAKVDTNKDGFITKAEADKFRADRRGAKGKKADGKHRGKHRGHMFERLDTNKDGKISKAEASAKAARMFTMLDTNKDGVITRAEAQNARKTWKGKKGHKSGKGKRGASNSA
jgi:Ca2+-binding EF-hand superfamily protein